MLPEAGIRKQLYRASWLAHPAHHFHVVWLYCVNDSQCHLCLHHQRSERMHAVQQQVVPPDTLSAITNVVDQTEALMTICPDILNPRNMVMSCQ